MTLNFQGRANPFHWKQHKEDPSRPLPLISLSCFPLPIHMFCHVYVVSYICMACVKFLVHVHLLYIACQHAFFYFLIPFMFTSFFPFCFLYPPLHTSLLLFYNYGSVFLKEPPNTSLPFLLLPSFKLVFLLISVAFIVSMFCWMCIMSAVEGSAPCW